LQTRVEQGESQLAAPHFNDMMNGKQPLCVSQRRIIVGEWLRSGAGEFAFGVLKGKPVALHSSLRLQAGAQTGLSAIGARFSRPMIVNP
jgi:hypothetical protein